MRVCFQLAELFLEHLADNAEGEFKALAWR